MKEMLVIFIFSTSVFLQNSALALECPTFPAQFSKDWEVEVNAAVAKIGPVAGSELQTRTRNATQDLLGRLPNAGPIYLEQMMYAAYCSGLRDDKSLSETQKAQRLHEYNSEVRKTIEGPGSEPSHSSVRPPSKQEALSNLPSIEWGPLNKYFTISNYKLGEDETTDTGLSPSNKEGIAFDVTCKKPPSGFTFFTVIFFDSEGIEMGRSSVTLSPKYPKTGWVQGMLGKGFIYLTIEASDIKVIKIAIMDSPLFRNPFR